MGTFTALVLATPIFGLSLVPPVAAPPSSILTRPPIAIAAPARVPRLAQAAEGAPAEPPPPADTAEPTAAEQAELDAALEASEGFPDEDPCYLEDVEGRADTIRLHKPFGIATWISMGVTLLLGGIQYHNLYGPFQGQDSNPCVEGNAIFGQGQCTGTPVLHLTSSIITGALYTTTFALSVYMPDPDNADEGDSEFASTLSLHKILRYVHLGGMISQFILGPIIANADAFGMDRANDYGTLQALATVHLTLGIITYAALTWAMALLL